MKKIINNPDRFVDEVIEGILRAHPDDYKRASSDGRAIVRAPGESPIVGIVTGGGSGHLPLFLGYVGSGLLSGVAVGNVFSSPSPAQIDAATRASDMGRGVLYLYGNYGGDVYNFGFAADMAVAYGRETTTVLGTDDLLSAPIDQAATRRGVAGLVFAYKTAGAAAARGLNLAQVTEVAQRTVDRTRTIGVGLAPTILPAVGKPTFTLADGEMEIGVGIHGESGLETVPIESADQIAARFIAHLATEIDFGVGTRLGVLVNGLGATPLEELYVLYRAIDKLVAESGSRIVFNFVGEYATSLEMAGASVSVVELDDELESLLLDDASSPFYRPGTPVTTTFDDLDTDDSHDEAVDEVELGPFENSARAAILRLVERMPEFEDELRGLDAALGDGDLGITVRSGSNAIRDRVRALPENAALSALLRESGVAFASANPSTFAALMGYGLLSASQVVDDTVDATCATALQIGRTIAAAIGEKGGAVLGDKTLLDVLLPALDRIEATDDTATLLAAIDELVATSALSRSRKGRAAWHQERSEGLADPGSVAVARALKTLLE